MVVEKGVSGLVSVIVPAYNYGHLLGETLENLTTQVHQNWECIVVDDGSSDNTREVAMAWCERDQRFNYVFQVNAGLSAARNTGIRKSKGEFIQLLDADDLLEPGKFSNQLRIFESNPHAGIVYSEVRYFDHEHPTEKRFTLIDPDLPWISRVTSANHHELLNELTGRNLFAVNCPLIRKTVFHNNGNFNVNLPSLEDWEFWCRCAFNGVFFLFDPAPDSFALVRTHLNSMSRNKSRMLETGLVVQKTIQKLIDGFPDQHLRSQLTRKNYEGMRFLHIQLYSLYKEQNKRMAAFSHLVSWSFGERSFRHFLKHGLNLWIGFPAIP